MCCPENSHTCGDIPERKQCLTCTADEEARCCTSTGIGSFLWQQVVGQWQYTLEVTMCETPRSKLSKLKSSIPVCLYLQP